MTAIVITAPGGPEVLRPLPRAVPHPGPGEVLIRVAAAGLNHADILQREGRYPPPVGAPADIPGLEVSGEVVALGEGAGRLALGERVTALLAGGGYAEYCVAPAGQCLPVPKGVGMAAAAAIPEAYFTVWMNVFERAALEPGETLLVHGGASGIGTTAIQMARSFGATVLATAGSAEKCKACRELGAQDAFDRTSGDFVPRVLEATGGRGVDVILDMVGGSYLARNVRVLAEGGRLLQIAVLTGSVGELDLGVLMRKRLTLAGSTLRPRSVLEKSRIAAAVQEHVWPQIEKGRLSPVVHETLPLREAAKAHSLLEANQHVGKIVLAV